jgi:nicotinamide-nucleotide amidase
VRDRHADTLFSDDCSSVDDQVAEACLRTRAWHRSRLAESWHRAACLAARLTERAGSSAYVSRASSYANEGEDGARRVDPALIERVGAVSTEVGEALAAGARERLGAGVGIGITGIAGPGGGTEDKPVGTVCFSVTDGTRTMTRRQHLPGSRAEIRDRSTTLAMHMIRRVLLGESD